MRGVKARQEMVDIAQMYESGWNFEKIARFYDKSPSTIGACIRRIMDLPALWFDRPYGTLRTNKVQTAMENEIKVLVENEVDISEVRPNRTISRLSRKDFERVNLLYNRMGLPIAEVARILGLSISAIRHRLVLGGYPVRTRSQELKLIASRTPKKVRRERALKSIRQRGIRTMTPDLLAECIRLYEEEMLSSRQIAEQVIRPLYPEASHAANEQFVRSNLRNAGVQMRDNYRASGLARKGKELRGYRRHVAKEEAA